MNAQSSLLYAKELRSKFIFKWLFYANLLAIVMLPLFFQSGILETIVQFTGNACCYFPGSSILRKNLEYYRYSDTQSNTFMFAMDLSFALIIIYSIHRIYLECIVITIFVSPTHIYLFSFFFIFFSVGFLLGIGNGKDIYSPSVSKPLAVNLGLIDAMFTLGIIFLLEFIAQLISLVRCLHGKMRSS